MKSQAHIYYQELVENPVSITGMSVREKISALEYAKEVRAQQEDLIQRMIVGSPSYQYPKEYLPDHKFEYWESKEGKVTKAVNVIALIEANLPAYNKPGEKVSPPLAKSPEVAPVEEVKEVSSMDKKKRDKKSTPPSAETYALFHRILEYRIPDLDIKTIPFKREKEGSEIAMKIYGLNRSKAERFYKEYHDLRHANSDEGFGIKERKDWVIKRLKKQMFALAQKYNYPEFIGWWNTVIEE